MNDIKRNQRIIMIITVLAIIATAVGIFITIHFMSNIIENPELIDNQVKTASEFVNHVDSVYNSAK